MFRYSLPRCARVCPIDAHKTPNRQPRLHSSTCCRASNNNSLSPEEALAAAAAELGVDTSRLRLARQHDEWEDWEDVMEEMEDPWMREPAPPLEIEGITTNTSHAAALQPPPIHTCTIAQLQDMHNSMQESMLVLCIDDGSNASETTRTAATTAGISYTTYALRDLTRDLADSLRQYHALVVLMSVDHQSQQACVRLTKVFDLPAVYHCGIDMEEV